MAAFHKIQNPLWISALKAQLERQRKRQRHYHRAGPPILMLCQEPCSPPPRVMQSPQTEFRFVPCVLSHFSCVWLFATPWTVACQIPLSMGFSRREYWNALLYGMPCPSPKDPPDPGTEPSSLWSPALADRFFIISTTWEAQSWGLDLMITQRTQRAFPHFSLEALSVH